MRARDLSVLASGSVRVDQHDRSVRYIRVGRYCLWKNPRRVSTCFRPIRRSWVTGGRMMVLVPSPPRRKGLLAVSGTRA